MDRHRGDRYGGAGGGGGAAINNSYNQDSFHSRRPSRFPDGPPPRFSDGHVSRFPSNGTNFDRRSPNDYRGGGGGGGGGHRGFESPPRHTPPVGGGGGIGAFPPPGGGGHGGFRPMGGGGGGFAPNYQGPPPGVPPQPLSGQKRGYPFPGRENSPDSDSGGSFAKLFVGSVPRTATEDDIRPLFELHGKVVEVALIKDKRTGQQQGCCFVKYGSSEAADRAIRALHNQVTLPGGLGPIQVRYADGERERLGAVEYKLFVGSLNKQATEKEVEEIFSPYGHVEDVYLMRDEMKQSRGCGFVKFSQREVAMAAINALNGIYKMRGCDQPLTVRFADPKRPRAGEARGTPAFGGPGFGPRLQGPGQRPPPNFGEPMGNRPPNAWGPISPQNMGPSPNVRAFGNQPPNSSGDLATPPNQSLNQPLQVPPVSQQISPLQKPIQSPQSMPPLQLHPQVTPHGGQLQTQAPFSQAPSSQQYQGMGGQLAMPTQAALNMSAPSNPTPGVANQHQMAVPVQQSPSPLAQMVSQQKQNLQATFQSSQQTFSQLQQQYQMMQPSSQNLPVQQNSQPAKQQWPGIAPQTPPTTLASDVTLGSTSSAPLTTGMAQPVAPVKSIWTEHTSPEGFKYYYNSVTRESRWEKPEELTLSEQPPPPQQKPQSQPNPQAMPGQQGAPQMHLQPQFQPQFRHPHPMQQQQQPSFPASYTAAPGGRIQQDAQGLQATQEWMWKNKAAGPGN